MTGDDITTEEASVARPAAWTALPWTSISALTLILGAVFFFWYRTRLPERVIIAGGPDGGRYAELAHQIAKELEQRLHIDVEVKPSAGSMENLDLLKDDSVSLGLYQSGTQQVLRASRDLSDLPAVHFVGNLYSEFLLPFGRRATPTGVALTKTSWSTNNRFSGDYATTRILLQHLGIDESSVRLSSFSFTDLPKKLKNGDVEVGIVCCGLGAPALKGIVKSPDVRLIPLPAVEAFARKHSTLAADVIPHGYFSTEPMLPPEDFHTVSLRAQMLASSEAPVRLVEEVTAIILDADFQRRNQLTHLLDEGVDYAASRPEFELHPGASHVYYPDLKPLVNPDFVEGTEGLRSFFVSLVAAIWLLHRWWKRRQIRSQEHRLDRYIRELLQLEREQVDVDGEGGPEEAVILQKYLDRITLLRQEALGEFSAHELNDDSAVGCLIQMCHALSDKVNAKLVRHAVLQLTAVQKTAHE